MNEELAKNVFDMLMSADFEDWYQSEFMPFVEGDENAPSKTVILKWLDYQLNQKSAIKVLAFL